ncbi:MAG: alpha-E domain-containing protein [Puniceicoccales bacterium]
MLSRVADSLYWLARYMERADNLARLVEVNLQLLLDFQDLDNIKLKEHWDPVIRSTGDEETFYNSYEEATSQTVTEFMTFDVGNPNSVISCVMAARENARMVRDQISSELWETLNNLYLFLKSADAQKVWASGAYEFYDYIKQNSLLFQGLVNATLPRDECYDFLMVGKYIERADKTTRMLDVKYHILLPNVQDVGGAVDTAQWVALLRAASAYDAYHARYLANIDPSNVAEFLIFSESFPRSLRFCAQELNARLHNISGCPFSTYSNEAEKLAGKLLSDLTFSSIQDVIKYGMHEWLDYCQERLNEIGQSTYQAYMFQKPLDLAEEIQSQQQQGQ